jgi:hypothetical protein
MIALDFGKVVASGSPTQVRESPAVIASYLGVERASVEAELGTGEHHLDATELTLGLVGEETDEEVRP